MTPNRPPASSGSGDEPDVGEPTIEVNITDPGDAAAQHCLRSYFAELDRRFDAGFDPARSLPADVGDMRPPTGLFLVAKEAAAPVGCGALMFHPDEVADLKRMWVAPVARGRGVGRRLLSELERRALDRGCHTVRLETNKVLTEAIAMYRSAGYREVVAFNDETYAHHWFEKQLTDRRTRR